MSYNFKHFISYFLSLNLFFMMLFHKILDGL